MYTYTSNYSSMKAIRFNLYVLPVFFSLFCFRLRSFCTVFKNNCKRAKLFVFYIYHTIETKRVSLYG